MKRKHFLNKSGAALAYVLGVSILLLVLCSAVMLVARHNLSTWSRATDGRQTFIDAGSAVEFAKSEIYYQARDTGSQISIGNPSYNFYVKKDNNFGFETSMSKPADDEYAAECKLNLIKTEHYLVRTTKVWVDGVPFKSAITGKWAVADYEQTFVTTSLPKPNPATVAYKEFDISWIPAGEVIIQIVDDEFTRYTYEADIDAEISYKTSDRVRKESFKCEVVPGYAIKHTAKPPYTDGEPPSLGYWIATGGNYGTTYISDNENLNSLPSGVTGHNTIHISENVNSAYPVFYSPRVVITQGTKSLVAPAVYFHGLTKENSLLNSVCLEANSNVLNINTKYLFVFGGIANHNSKANMNYAQFNLKTEKDVVMRFDAHTGNSFVIYPYESVAWADRTTIPTGYYKFTAEALKKDYINLLSLSSTSSSPNYWGKYLTSIPQSSVPVYIIERDKMIGTGVSTNELDKLISSELDKKLGTNPGEGWGTEKYWRSNGCQWTFEGDVAKIPYYSSDPLKYRNIFGPTYIREKNFGHVNFTNDLSDGKNVFAYFSDVTGWSRILDEMGIYTYNVPYEGLDYEYEYMARNIYLQYDNASPLIVPDGLSIAFNVGGDGDNESEFYYGVAQSNIIEQGHFNSSFNLRISKGSNYKFIFPTDVKIKMYNGIEYTIKAGTYTNGVPFETVSGDNRSINLFSNNAKNYFSQANPPGFTPPPNGSSGGGGTSEVEPPADGGETPGVTNPKKNAEFKEGRYE